MAEHELSKKSKKSGTSGQMERAGKRVKPEDIKDKAARQTKPRRKLRRDRLIFRKEGTKGFIRRLALWSDVVNLKDQRKAISS